MKDARFIYTSLTRIADFHKGFDLSRLDRPSWSNGDYVVCRIEEIGGSTVKAELANGRMMHLMEGDLMVGALGVRHATLEATGSWEEVGEDGHMQILTGAGLLGKLTSRSRFVTPLIDITYLGHVCRNGIKMNMANFAGDMYAEKLDIPVILLVGTSMSSGKTTSARIVTRMLKYLGKKVSGAKLTGAGRYRDILTVSDAGADHVCDFVDAGLPSSICPPGKFKEALHIMMGQIANSQSDVAVIEIGASPLEPYNGDIAIAAVRDEVCCSILCASDPYSVYGIMKSFEFTPTVVTGPAVNTIAGAELVHKICGVPTLNLIEASNAKRVQEMLIQCLNEKTISV